MNMPDRLFYEDELAATSNSLAKKKKERQELASELETLEANLTGPQDLVRRGLLKQAISVKDLEIDDDEALAKSYRKRLDAFTANEPKAAEIRKRLAEELWPQSAKILSKIQSSLSDISSAITEIDQVNVSMRQLLSEHERLVGESITVPAISAGLIPNDLRRLIAIKLPSLPETLELKLRSQEIRDAQERLEAASRDRLSKQKRLIQPYLETTKMIWPSCRICRQELVCIAAWVYDPPQQETGFGLPEVREKAFRLQFSCEGGSHMGSKGFLELVGGPYHLIPLSQLEVER
jgi:hypothetical protein